MIYSGKIGVDKAGPTIVNWPQASSDAFTQAGTLVERESGVLKAHDGDGNIFGIAGKATAGSTSVVVELVPKGGLITADLTGDLTHDGGTNTAGIFEDDSFVPGLANVLVGAKLRITSCAATPAQVGRVYNITASHESDGTITTDATYVFADGDTVALENLEDTGTRMIGIDKVPLINAAATGFAVDGTWETTLDYYMIMGVANPSKILIAALKSEF